MSASDAILIALTLGLVGCAVPGDATEPPPLSDDDDATDENANSTSNDDDATGEDDPVGDDDDSAEAQGDDDDSAGMPQGDCPADSLEENDELGAAPQLTPGLYTDLTSCSDDEDWHAVFVPAGQQLTVAASFIDDEGDIDVSVHDAGGAWLAGGSTTNDNELVGPMLSDSDDWMFVKVRLFGDAGTVPGNDYDLDLSVAAPPPPEVCPLDSFEENDDMANAWALSPTSEAALVVCSADADWYAIDVLNGQTVTASTLFPHAEGDVDIHLYDAAEAWLASSASVTDDEDISWTSNLDGTVYLRVSLFSDNGSAIGNDYDLSVGVQ